MLDVEWEWDVVAQVSGAYASYIPPLRDGEEVILLYDSTHVQDFTMRCETCAERLEAV